MTEKDTLQIFLETLLSPVGSGVFLWGAVAFIIKAIPPLNQHEDAKFWLAFVTSLLIPPGALGLQIALGYATFTGEAMFTAIGVGYMTSQAVHRGTSAVRAKVAENEEKAREEEIKVLSKAGTPVLPIAPAAPRFEDTTTSDIPESRLRIRVTGDLSSVNTPSYIAPIDGHEYDGDSGDAIPFDGERGASGGR